MPVLKEGMQTQNAKVNKPVLKEKRRPKTQSNNASSEGKMHVIKTFKRRSWMPKYISVERRSLTHLKLRSKHPRISVRHRSLKPLTQIKTPNTTMKAIKENAQPIHSSHGQNAAITISVNCQNTNGNKFRRLPTTMMTISDHFQNTNNIQLS
jgi:hypothetical protein